MRRPFAAGLSVMDSAVMAKSSQSKPVSKKLRNNETNMRTKTKTKIKKLPKGLPPLPPVPAGYDAWKLCGWGAKIKGQYITTSKGDHDWDQLRSVETESMAYKELYYALAIKHPAPKPAAKGRKAVKARRMYSSMVGLTSTHSFGLASKHSIPSDIPVAVLDISDESALLLQVQLAISAVHSGNQQEAIELSRAVLESLGLIAKRRK